MKKTTNKGDEEPKVEGLVGDYTWEQTRNVLVKELISAETEEEFLEVIDMLLKSIGTYVELKKTREDLGIKPFTNEEKQRFCEEKEETDWTEEEVYELIKMYKAQKSYKEISEKLGRTISACQTMIHNIHCGVDKFSRELR